MDLMFRTSLSQIVLDAASLNLTGSGLCSPQNPSPTIIAKPKMSGIKTAAVPHPCNPKAAGPNPSPRPTIPSYRKIS